MASRPKKTVAQARSIGDGESVPLIKFPRTPHMFDAGGSGVTRDDLLMDESEVKARYLSGQTVSVEEKVDGANLGVSMAPDWTFRVQNRSHFVNASTHTQFKGLDTWLERHRADLMAILGEPGQRILFGEWLFARHSIPYTHLPAYFLAFDIYDCASGAFLGRAERDEIIGLTSIPIVPLVAEGTFASREELLELLNTRSQFYDGFVEGVYLRVSRDGAVADRCKLVRPDFVQNIGDHWMSRELVRNIVRL